jgi:CHASE2 domain-containing sensor protein
MFTAVKPKSVEIIALLLIAAAAIIGVIAISAGDWVAVASMVLLVLGQGLVFRKVRVDARRGSDEANRRPLAR